VTQIAMLGTISVSIICWLYAPSLWLMLILLNGSVWLAVQSLHLLAAVTAPTEWISKTKSSVALAHGPEEPFVSVHVAIHEEPPELVIRTLEALDHLVYDNLEVIVLDNNTKSRQTWAPVQKWCSQLRQKSFIFKHFEGVREAKAGALNICLQLMNNRTKYVAVIDADYVVTRDFLSIATQALEYRNVSFVQFPQSYRGTATAGGAVATELDDYFNAFARRANETRSVMLTGTLSVISAEALHACGGWSGRTVTEDAELGVRLFEAGHEGLFLDTVVGQGLLPLTYDGLRLQRNRWVSGNLQTLRLASRKWHDLWARDGVCSVVTQLTAWPGFWAIPVAAIVLGSGLNPNYTSSPSVAAVAIYMSSLTIIVSLVLSLMRLALTCSARGKSMRDVLPALVVKWSLMWPSSWAWLEALALHSVSFKRTPKSRSQKQIISLPNLGIASVSALVGVSYAVHAHILPALACVLVAASMPTAMWVDAALNRYAQKVDATY
jgi:cellulose synthase/poly-beta-1,6-N-acetylglucosamine synthase-like glycosyltransferase